MAQHPLLISELYPIEIEKELLFPTFIQFFQSYPSFPLFLELFEQKVLNPLQEDVELLITSSKDLLSQDLSSRVLTLKHSLFNRSCWLLEQKAAYQTAYPESLTEQTKTQFVELLARFTNLHHKLEPLLITAKQSRIDHFHAFFPKALPSLLQAVEQELTLPADASKETHSQLNSFLSECKTHLTHLLNFLKDNIEEIEEQVFTKARGLFINPTEVSPYPLLYSLEGNIYIVMEVLGHYIGGGIGKVVSKTFELKTAYSYALIHSRTRFANAKNPEEEQQHIQIAFFQTWFESQFLKQLQGKVGILPLIHRMVFSTKTIPQIFLIEEYFRGGNLQQHLLRAIENPALKLELTTQIQLALQMLSGLVAIHEQKIVHHDIKLNNILLDFEKEPKAAITDFHYAFYGTDSEKKNASNLNFYWAAPEFTAAIHDPIQLKKAQSYPLDVWSMGLALYCFFNYVPIPWENKKEEEVPPHLASLKSGWVPNLLKTKPFYPLLNKMLEPDPSKRIDANQSLALFKEIIDNL